MMVEDISAFPAYSEGFSGELALYYAYVIYELENNLKVRVMETLITFGPVSTNVNYVGCKSSYIQGKGELDD